MSDEDRIDELPRRFQRQITGRRWQAARQRAEREVRQTEEAAVRAERRAAQDKQAAEWAAFVSTILREHPGEFSRTDREALRLTYIERLGSGDAWRRATNCPSVGAYKGRLHRARRRLRDVAQGAGSHRLNRWLDSWRDNGAHPLARA